MRQGRTKAPKEPGTVKRLSKIELKAQRFAKAYVKHGLNGTKAAMEVYEPKNEHTAASIATENLRKPVMVQAIQEQLEEHGITRELRDSILKRNMVQDKNLPASNTAVDMVNKMVGDYAPERSVHLNVDVPSDMDGAIKALQDELQALQ